MFTSLSLLIVCSVAFTQANSNNKTVLPVPFTLYYESLCPYSERFILNQLVPTYDDKDFAGLLANMDLVPYGHVYDPDFSKYKYTCQHGVPECEGNKLHGCAIKYIEDKSTLLHYFSCLINITQSVPILSYPVNECKNIVPDDKMLQISKCYNSTEGWDLFNKHGEATKNFFGSNRFYVPYVSFNRTKNENISVIGRKNFKKALCIENGVKHTTCS
ncbi:unnamed protein product [Nezara viridula]|uniref:Uncharacterized protein n=1 Tax=Nezara viridula TaxID=85310 RepID=A0A9P0E569_NEZVI|nr:unnamed protein product [Nezara viridula]